MEAKLTAPSATIPFMGAFSFENSATSFLEKSFRALAPKLSLSLNHWAHQNNAHNIQLSEEANAHNDRVVIGRNPENHSPKGAGQTQTQSSRWNPTPEQIKTLEMLYKSGIRTPNAEQIEHITAQLKNYGKIEGKNVFYWFQNHKARERQKQKRNSLQAATAEERGSILNKSSLSSVPVINSADRKSPEKQNRCSANSSYTSVSGGSESSCLLLHTPLLTASPSPKGSTSLGSLSLEMRGGANSPEKKLNNKRKERSWEWSHEEQNQSRERESSSAESFTSENENESESDEAERDRCTLKLFPLRPEGLLQLHLPSSNL
eukprot:TRINITY_DN23864_c0_g1_i1.p1 TRINITY_DN23864_c0_g1~~TRINITY_DN23864_c0_g1_i1.p1  ORF type:complete len:343 (-),score=73.82 TRINITY_DN23864_c0_g1_i1:9-965(-)